VKVMVPSNRLAEFYEMHGAFLRDGAATPVPEASRPGPLSSQRRMAQGPLSAWTDERVRMWTVDGTDEDRNLAVLQLMRDLSPKAGEFLRLLLERDSLEAPATEIVQHLGLSSSHALAGTLSSFGAAGKRLGRHQPFEWREDAALGTVYYLDPRIAKVFRSVLGLDSQR